jgi:hypothetical protein
MSGRGGGRKWFWDYVPYVLAVIPDHFSRKSDAWDIEAVFPYTRHGVHFILVISNLFLFF